uniref:Transmembrane channel-like protein n=1 Tax=Sus scrofa TaxID=9823 RepID=A0A8D1SCK6_PIG
MSAYYRNNAYEEDPDAAYYSGSQNHPRGYLNTPNYPEPPDPLNNPDYPSTRRNPYSADSRTGPDYPGSLAEPDYPGSQRNPDYPGNRRNPYAAGSRSSDYPASWAEPDYPGSPPNPYHSGPSREPDDSASQHNPAFAGSRSSGNYAGSRTNPDYLGSLGEPDYPGAQGNTTSPGPSAKSNQPGSRRNPESAGSRINPYIDALGQPDYPGAENQPDPPNFWGEPDYPDAEDYRHAPNLWGDLHLNIFQGKKETPFFFFLAGQKLIASLIPMTSRDRIKAIRNQPRTMDEKRNLRKIVEKEKSKQSRRILELTCCAQCLNSMSLTYRRVKNSLSELLHSINLWQKTFKVIRGKFGTSVLSYFNFLRWLLKFNVLAFVVTFSFIIIPQLTVAPKNHLQFTGLEFVTGAGYFSDTVMYYGFYTNSTIRHGDGGASYNMQLAYIFTIGAYLVTCFFSLLFSMARYFRNNFINPHVYSRGIAKLIFCWDFTVTQESAVKLKQKNLSTEIQENLSEIRQENVKLTFKQQLVHFSAHLAAWVVSTGVAIACCVAVYYLAENNSEFLANHRDPGAVLLLPFVVSCINLAVPRFYSMFRLVEHYEMPRHEVYSLLIRNIFLKISIIGILCYYWLNIVALAGEECWETLIGQEIYRLLLMDFVFSLADSLLGEFLRRIIGTRFIRSLGLQEFDIARNVLELIYAQTLVWIGTFFCPLLPFIQMITLFIMFYVKNVSHLMMNFQPPSKAWRASQMMTFFILLLFFPSLIGVLCTLAITIWRLKPSAGCGPFRGLPFFIQSIYSWIDTLSKRPSYLWVVWIYQNLIGSVHFFFILTLIVLIITYLYWQITEGRKIMIRLLHEQIINEGKDKMFLIEKLLKLQDTEKRANSTSFRWGRVCLCQLLSLVSNPDLRFRRSVQEDNPKA